MPGMPDPVILIVSLSLLALAPFFAVMMTSFAKIVVVLSLVRNALGLQQVPPNLVMNGLALVLTLFIMAPVGHQLARISARNLEGGGSHMRPRVLFSILSDARGPLKKFLSKHAQPEEREFFLKAAQKIWPARDAKLLNSKDLLVLVPAFTVSELIAAFKIGVLLYLAFVVIDLVVANVLVALGMVMFSPTVVSIPLKLLLFVMLDGWGKLLHGLILTYR